MNRHQTAQSTTVPTVVLDKKTTNVLPAGKYYIGDLSYFLHSGLQGRHGHYAIPDGRGFISARADNGLWSAEDTVFYTVESGFFGICSYELGSRAQWTGDGTFHTFDAPVSMKVHNDGDAVVFSSGTWNLRIEYLRRDISDDEGYDSCG
jgi:hypothetical protein